jgi:3-methyladenine DNA glycosylase AlkC
MAEALKDMYHIDFLEDFGTKVNQAYDLFDVRLFIERVMDESWNELALRARMIKITRALGEQLPKDYKEAIKILYKIDESCVGFPYLFFPDFVAEYGQAEEHFEISMEALERFTCKSSSEFAIRPFILNNTEKTMEHMLQWSKHPNEHVRRLSSEGCRPRLPWGVSLPVFKKDPTKVIKILNELKTDPSLYVRKSVANNLNDIAKDNPNVVIHLARKWIGKDDYTDWILRQGLRTLVRKGNPDALKLFGYKILENDTSLIKRAMLTVNPTELKLGDSCKLSYELDIKDGEEAHLRIEYAIDFVKAKGKISRKIFLLTDKTVQGSNHLTGNRTHSFSDLTTRRHYSGLHRVVLLVNGQEYAEAFINLLME